MNKLSDVYRRLRSGVVANLTSEQSARKKNNIIWSCNDIWVMMKDTEKDNGPETESVNYMYMYNELFQVGAVH